MYILHLFISIYIYICINLYSICFHQRNMSCIPHPVFFYMSLIKTKGLLKSVTDFHMFLHHRQFAQRLNPRNLHQREAKIHKWSRKGMIYLNLVGGWTNPFEKYAPQIGSSPQVWVKIKNLSNRNLPSGKLTWQAGMTSHFLIGNTSTQSGAPLFQPAMLVYRSVSEYYEERLVKIDTPPHKNEHLAWNWTISTSKIIFQPIICSRDILVFRGGATSSSEGHLHQTLLPASFGFLVSSARIPDLWESELPPTRK